MTLGEEWAAIVKEADAAEAELRPVLARLVETMQIESRQMASKDELKAFEQAKSRLESVRARERDFIDRVSP